MVLVGHCPGQARWSGLSRSAGEGLLRAVRSLGYGPEWKSPAEIEESLRSDPEHEPDDDVTPSILIDRSLTDIPLPIRSLSEFTALFPEAVRRLAEPETYPVWLDASVYQKKLELIEAARRNPL